jgi:hypothetical protein
MTVIEKVIKKEELTKEEIEFQRAVVLLQISKMRTILLKLEDNKDKEEFSKSLTLLMLYSPSDWSSFLLKSVDSEGIEKLIKEEPYLIQ